LSLDELRQFDVGTAQPGSAYARTHPLLAPMNARIPTLEDVTALSTGRLHLFVELKCDAGDDSADPVALAEAAYAITGNQVIYVGFDWRALMRVHQLGGACWFTTDKLPDELSGDARLVIDAIAQSGGQGWFPNFPDALPDNVAHARKRGLKVGAWTVNDSADMHRLKELDALCTDRPDIMAACQG
jgi:glycerophosphoryl diester phosphodiesterase